MYADLHKIIWTIVYWTDIKILNLFHFEGESSLLSELDKYWICTKISINLTFVRVTFQIEKIILKILDWSSNKRFNKYQFKSFFKNHFFFPLDSIVNQSISIFSTQRSIF